MGCTSSSPEAQRNSNINHKLKEEERHEKATAVKKFLFLGPGGSGKSTIFKQMQILFGKSTFPDDSDRLFYRNNIRRTMMVYMQELLHQLEEQNIVLPTAELRESAQVVREFDSSDTEHKGDFPDFPSYAPHLGTLWACEAVQQQYRDTERLKYQKVKVFFDKLDEIRKVHYQPTKEDILYCRVKTTGITEYTCEINKSELVCYDVGGQRNERKKWIHCFEGVTAVVYVAALDTYDMVLEEDLNTNALVEALTLFQFVANLEWFKNVGLILFLNKRDVFQAKIGIQSNLADYFPEFPGPEHFEPGFLWIKNQFLLRVASPKRKDVYVHLTCATDEKNIKTHLVASATHHILTGALKKSGFGLGHNPMI